MNRWIEDLKQRRRKWRYRSFELQGPTLEVLWSQIFNQTIVGSDWFHDIPLSPGRWAIGYYFLYPLYRILNECHPKSILDLGLGQSSRMVGAYLCNCEYGRGASHTIVEHDENWVAFCNKTQECYLSHSQIVSLPIKEVSLKGIPGSITRYDNFVQKIGQKKYDLILVDAPFGSDYCSRIDILDLIPEALADNFIILVDDAERRGERNMAKLLEKKLKETGVSYRTGTYRGQKDMILFCAPQMGFLTSL